MIIELLQWFRKIKFNLNSLIRNHLHNLHITNQIPTRIFLSFSVAVNEKFSRVIPLIDISTMADLRANFPFYWARKSHSQSFRYRGDINLRATMSNNVPALICISSKRASLRAGQWEKSGRFERANAHWNRRSAARGRLTGTGDIAPFLFPALPLSMGLLVEAFKITAPGLLT